MIEKNEGRDSGYALPSPDFLADLIFQWGNAASLAAFDTRCLLFSLPYVHGSISYRLELNYALVFGDPLCCPTQWHKLIEHFTLFCAQSGKKIIYLLTSLEFMKWLLNHSGKAAIQIGNEILLNPSHNFLARSGYTAGLVRNRYNHARRSNVTVHEYTSHEANIEEQIEQLYHQWRTHRKGLQAYYATGSFFSHRQYKRYFYARYGSQMVGVLIMNSMQGGKGWALHLLIASPNAPSGTTEFLLLTAFELLQNEQCTFFSGAIVPIHTQLEIIGLGPASSLLMQAVFHISKKLFKLDQRFRFWKKFQPVLKPTYLVLSESGRSISQIRAIMRAFNIKI